MKRLFHLLLTWLALAAPAFAADPLDGVLPLAQDDIAAVAQIKSTPERHVLLFFGDQLN